MNRPCCDICGRKMPRRGYDAPYYRAMYLLALLTVCPKCDKKMGEWYRFKKRIDAAHKCKTDSMIFSLGLLSVGNKQIYPKTEETTDEKD